MDPGSQGWQESAVATTLPRVYFEKKKVMDTSWVLIYISVLESKKQYAHASEK